ncbi:MAG TPA: DUF2231 domain-containing protein [Bacteroidetes bacterium]|nr:DUF2231 domain-containing protein [Bacteroidota bacterium]
MPLHPSFVHFPIVLLILAGIIYLLDLILPNKKLGTIGFYLHVGGMLGIIAAILTGDYAENNLVQTREIHDMIETHEQLGMLSAYAFGILGVWAYLRQKSNIVLEKIVFVVMFLGIIGVLSFTSHLGGRMVFEKGAGVVPMEPVLELQRNSPANGGHPLEEVE